MKEQGKGEGDKRTDRLLTGISISLVCDTKNKAIIATSPNDIQQMIYRNIYCSPDISGLEINPYKRYSSVLDRSSPSLARGYDDYWKVNCYVFVRLPVALARVPANSVWK